MPSAQIEVRRQYSEAEEAGLIEANWGIRGGQAASDLDLGFDIDV